MGKVALMEFKNNEWLYRQSGFFLIDSVGCAMCGSLSNQAFWTTDRVTLFWTDGPVWFETVSGAQYKLEKI